MKLRTDSLLTDVSNAYFPFTVTYECERQYILLVCCEAKAALSVSNLITQHLAL